MDASDILDPAQFERIKNVHKGFLFQHLYAVACYLNAPRRGVAEVLIEHDEDVQLICDRGPLYVQIRNRGTALAPSDVSDALRRFTQIRVEHEAGRRKGIPRFAVVSNARLGPTLEKRVGSEEVTRDTALICGPAAASPFPELIPPTESTEELFRLCVSMATQLRLSTVPPETLVWKLAACVAAAAAGHFNRRLEVAQFEHYCELLRVELGTFPVVEDYVEQMNEPALPKEGETLLLQGHSGAGKTCWAANAAKHHHAVVVYLDCASASPDALAGRLVVQLGSTLAAREIASLHETVLPGANSEETLSLIDRLAREREVAGVVVLDNAHLIDAKRICDAVRRTSHLSWVFLAQPSSETTRLSTLLGSEPESLNGWSDDVVAALLKRSGCASDPRAVEAVKRLTDALPLLVLRTVEQIAHESPSQPTDYCERIEELRHSTRSPAEVILENAFAALETVERETARHVATSPARLTADRWIRVLSATLDASEESVASSLRALRTLGIVQQTHFGELVVHGAFRTLALGSAPPTEKVLSAVADLILSDPDLSRTPEHLVGVLQILAQMQRWKEFGDVVTEMAEWIRELGLLDAVLPLTMKSAFSETVRTEDRFWAADTAAFLCYERQDFGTAEDLCRLMSELLDQSETISGAEASLAHKRMLLAGAKGQLVELTSAYRRAAKASSGPRRELRYMYATLSGRLGRATDAVRELLDLAREYLAEGDLQLAALVGIPQATLTSKYSGRLDRNGWLHVADCFSAASQLGDAARIEPARSAFWGIQAAKFYQLAQAPESCVKAGMDVVDHTLRVLEDPGEALRQIESLVIPMVTQLRLVDYVVQARAQRAVVLAYCGRQEEAEQEMRTLREVYGSSLPETRSQELSHQHKLIAAIRAGERTLTAVEPEAPGPSARVGRNDKCPCGSGRKYKRCCLRKWRP